jgi:fucose 4-O-acetylase-like acetyltransferase
VSNSLKQHKYSLTYKTTNRDLSIDGLKVFEISLVVTGYFIQYSVKKFDKNFLLNSYIFSYPIIYFTSGYLSFWEKR